MERYGTRGRVCGSRIVIAIALSCLLVARATAVGAQSVPPIGTILDYGGVTPPPGYLFCHGQQVSRTQYAALFAAIGTQFGGGDAVTTFHLPDLRGRFVRGRDAGAGNDPNAAGRTFSNPGGSTGDAVGSLQDDQFERHSHRVNRVPSPGDGGGGAFQTNSAANGNAADEMVFSNTGGDETRPKNVYVNKIIKYE